MPSDQNEDCYYWLISNYHYIGLVFHSVAVAAVVVITPPLPWYEVRHERPFRFTPSTSLKLG